MVKIRILAAAMCFVLAIGSVIPQQRAVTKVSAATTPQVGPGFVLPGSTTSDAQAGKYPSVAGAGNTVHIVANTNQVAQYWSKADTAASSGGPTAFGGTGGDTDYTEAAITAGPDGTLYAVWIVQNSGINMKRKPAGGDWGSTQAIYNTTSFLAYVDIAVSSSGQIFVVWNQDFLYRYTFSNDGGNNWSGAGAVSSKKPYKPVFVAGGANNTIVVAFGSGDGHAYVSLWNGTSFVTSDLTPFKASGDFFASAKPSVAPNGKIYVVFRNGSSAGGLYYSERQGDGSWPVSKLAGGKVYDASGISADAQNNLHISWSGDATGRWVLYYAFKPAAGDWVGPVNASGINDKIVADVDTATTIGARAYAHSVFETFDGSGGAAVRYQQFSGDSDGSGGGSGPSATPLLEGGGTTTRNGLLTVSFSDVTGAPDGLRYHWDAAPTNADAWSAFASPITVPAPVGISPDTCENHVLYTQVRKGTVEGTVAQDGEQFDFGVQAQVNLVNPHMSGLPASYGLGVQDAYTKADDGASDGDPTYSRESFLYLGVNGQADCSHLANFHIPGSDSDPTPRTITNDTYTGPVALPQGSAVGNRTIDVEVTDKLGNSKKWTTTLTYDPASPTGTPTDTTGLPVLAPGGSFTADSAKSIIRKLTFSNISVDDNLYGKRENLAAGAQFWGVWIANSTTDVAADSATLIWYPVRVPSPGSTFSVQWDLFSGLGFTSDLRNKSGTYYVYVRFLDGAGNPSQLALKTTVTLDAGYTIPTVQMPLLRK
jgi:hypothetical protein